MNSLERHTDSSSTAEDKVARTSQTNLRHRLLPGKSETIVYLHSLGCSLETWLGVAQRCAPKHSALLYDLRGHGMSKPTSEVQSIDDHVFDLLELLDILKLETVTLAGVSIGGVIAMAAAISHPERFSKLILAATDARIGTVDSWNQRIDSITTNSLPTLSSVIVNRWFSPRFLQHEPNIVKTFAQELSSTSEKSYLASCVVLRDTDYRPFLNQINLPTLIIGGVEDLAVPITAVRKLSSSIVGSQFLCLEQTGHLPPVERPQEVANAILNFMGSY